MLKNSQKLKENPLFRKTVMPLVNASRTARLKAVSKRGKLKPESAVLIFGFGRGGSTWLNEVIATLPNTATIWEPLAPHTGNEFDELGFTWDQYIPPSHDWPEAKLVFDNLFAGKALTWQNTLTERTSGEGLSAYLNAESLVFKFVDANGLVPWLLTQYEFERSPILLIRHPMATIASRFRHGAWDGNASEGFEYPDTLFPEIYDSHRSFLDSLSGRHKIFMAKWCLQNLKIINFLNKSSPSLQCVFYEDLLLNREDELKKIFLNWDVAFPRGSLSHSHKASATASKGSPLSGFEQLSLWRKSFNGTQISEMQDVLNYFGVDIYNGASDLPVK